ncbi:hypothetical protein BH20ACT2_BH20ACT2_03100 [soil metagenome]
MVPLDGDELRRWRAKAEETLAASQLMADHGRAAWACFLAEQGAQFAVKGLLHAVGAEAWGHDLVALVGRIEAATGTAPSGAVVAAGRRLARHYIPSRYPDAHPGDGPDEHYGAEDAAQARSDADEVLAFVDRLWSRISDEGCAVSHPVIDRRRAEQRALVERAAAWAETLPEALGVRSVVVFGSVARGDFNKLERCRRPGDRRPPPELRPQADRPSLHRSPRRPGAGGMDTVRARRPPPSL